MTDSAPAGFVWVCPACDRRVPRKFTECRCGYTPNWTEAPPASVAPVADMPNESPRSAFSSAAGTIASVVLALSVIVVGAWYMNHPAAPPPAIGSVTQAPISASGVTPAPLQASASHPAPADSAAPQTRPIESPSPERTAGVGTS